MQIGINFSGGHVGHSTKSRAASAASQSFHRDGDEPATPSSHAPLAPQDYPATIEKLLLDWQSTADQSRLEPLVATIRPLAERMAAATLRRHGIRDSFAVDEVVSLVLDHLRRLPGSPIDERQVSRFTPRRTARCGCSLIDSGQAFVLWLTRERAADVARGRRRQARNTTVFSELDKPAMSRLQDYEATGEDVAAQTDLCVRLRDIIPRLPPRERTVIELLLEGKSQAVIAHMLEVCEGTVSRLRGRATAALRNLLAE